MLFPLIDFWAIRDRQERQFGIVVKATVCSYWATNLTLRMNPAGRSQILSLSPSKGAMANHFRKILPRKLQRLGQTVDRSQQLLRHTYKKGGGA